MFMSKRLIIPIIIALALPQMVLAGYFSRDRVGTTGANFLKIGIGAKPIGMGEAFCAIGGVPESIYWNPAGISRIDSTSIAFMHAFWLDEIDYECLSYARPYGKGAIGMGIYYLGIGSIDKRDEIGDKQGSFNPYDLCIALGYGKRYENLDLGMNLKLIQQDIGDESAKGIAIDLGIVKRLFGTPLSLGLAVQNIGPKIKFVEEGYSLPLNIKLGASYRLLSARNLTLALDLNAPVDNRPSIHMGGDYLYNLLGDFRLALRCGYKTTTIYDLESLSGLSLGFGCIFKDYGLDYAWVPYSDLGDTHRISISGRF